MAVLVGRAEVLGHLDGALARADAGQGGLVLLTGEPGIGKTAVAKHVSGYARELGALVAWGVAWPGEGAPACWPWIQVLRELGLAVPEPGAADRAAQARFRFFDEVATALLGYARDRLLVLVLDDLHWADEASVALLDFVSRRLATARLLVVGTSREPLPGSSVPLAPLSTVDSMALVAQVLGRDP